MDHQERIVKTTAVGGAWSEAWTGFWEARSVREKTLLTWGGAVLALAIGWSVLWQPASDGRARLRESLPGMQRELAQMTAEADESRALAGAAASVAPGGQALKDALTASLSDHALTAAQVQLIGATVQVQMKNASFAAWTAWLDDVRKQFKVQVVEAHVSALKADGQVDITASLQPANTR
ncbi:type II secretion system protein GspM [Paraburkholderia lycopersici]|uniref:General secretion pathway protein M n=1 Tax=Paraburkholderia lycopersici TaxID=416944 RepID=A0A1G6U1D9_9BURK|nr:type II secretion system protein M [Paraburkholderia lycopersici]SDD35149.1 general secretion pathway protein M [Paraburkholderia lycopersici]